MVHAGDWVDVATLDAIEARAARLVGVAGNNDGAELHARLGEFARFEVDGVRFGVVHETGAAAGREARMDAAYAGPDAPDGARRARVRAQPHPVGHDDAPRHPAAESRIADRPPPSAGRAR